MNPFAISLPSWFFFALSAGLFCWNLSAVQAQNLQALSLEEAVQTGLERAYSLRIAERSKQVAENNDNWGAAGRLPELSFNVNNQNGYSNINNPTSFLNGAQTLSSGSTASLDATWQVYNGGRIGINKARLEQQVVQAKAEKLRSEEQVRQGVVNAYYTALVQRERLQIQKELLRYSRDKITYTETRQEFGQATEFDILQVRDAYLSDSINVLLQQNNYENALRDLMFNMGMDDYLLQDIQLSDSLRYDIRAFERDELEQQLVDNNQQLELQRIGRRLAELDIDLQKAATRPTFNISGNISEQLTLAQVLGSSVIPDGWNAGTTFSAGLNLSFRYVLYDGGNIKRNIENAELQASIVQLQLKDTERQLRNSLANLWAVYQQQQRVFALTQQLVSNAERNLTISEERFKLNTLNFFDFRTIQISYIRSLTALQDAFLNLKNTEIQIRLLTGEFKE